MFQTLKKKFTELKYFVKKHTKPSLFDLNYSMDKKEDPGKPLATPQMIEEYVRLGSDINEEQPDGKTGHLQKAIFLANANANHQAVMCLLGYGVSDKELDLLIKKAQNKTTKQALTEHKLARQKYQEECKRASVKDALLKLNYKTAQKDDINKLIEMGADVNIWNNIKPAEKERTPIYSAIEAGNYEAFHQLVERGANLSVWWDDTFPSEMARLYLDKTPGNKKIHQWFEQNKEFIQDIQNARRPFPSYDPLVMVKKNSAKKATETQIYVSKGKTYSFADYIPKSEQRENMTNLLSQASQKTPRKTKRPTFER